MQRISRNVGGNDEGDATLVFVVMVFFGVVPAFFSFPSWIFSCSLSLWSRSCSPDKGAITTKREPTYQRMARNNQDSGTQETSR